MYKQVNNGQQAQGVENGQADVPHRLFSPCSPIHGNEFHDHVEDKQHDDPGGDAAEEFIEGNIHWVLVLWVKSEKSASCLKQGNNQAKYGKDRKGLCYEHANDKTDPGAGAFQVGADAIGVILQGGHPNDCEELK